MRRNIIMWVLIIPVIFFNSCNNNVKSTDEKNIITQNEILQQDDGSISLKADKAECYHDMSNPSSNTAEWSVKVSKSGRFNVWLSSATKDTTNLQYKNSVRLSILDNRLEVRPECDKIIQNSVDVSFPYFRADSFIGSLYIQDTGLYNIQLISEKIIPIGYNSDDTSAENNSKFLSVFLTPITN